MVYTSTGDGYVDVMSPVSTNLKIEGTVFQVTNGRDPELIGPQGEQGPVGNQGPQGQKGTPGPTGPKGETGPQGPTGSKGDQGPRGDSVVGPTGQTGAVGDKGDPGEQGDVGDVGDPGYSATTLDTSSTFYQWSNAPISMFFISAAAPVTVTDSQDVAEFQFTKHRSDTKVYVTISANLNLDHGYALQIFLVNTENSLEFNGPEISDEIVQFGFGLIPTTNVKVGLRARTVAGPITIANVGVSLLEYL